MEIPEAGPVWAADTASLGAPVSPPPQWGERLGFFIRELLPILRKHHTLGDHIQDDIFRMRCAMVYAMPELLLANSVSTGANLMHYWLHRTVPYQRSKGEKPGFGRITVSGKQYDSYQLNFLHFTTKEKTPGEQRQKEFFLGKFEQARSSLVKELQKLADSTNEV
jgi:hypothetical protein